MSATWKSEHDTDYTGATFFSLLKKNGYIYYKYIIRDITQCMRSNDA